MLLCYVLTMPGAPTWNGRTSYNESLYARVRSVAGSKAAKARAAEIVERGYFTYAWSDGWRAVINVTAILPASARNIRKRSQGFAGYDWMIDSIERDLTIIAPHERERAAAIQSESKGASHA